MPSDCLAPAELTRAARRRRSSPVSSDFEEVGLEETRSAGQGVALGAGYSGVLVDSGDDSPSSESPELPVVWVTQRDQSSQWSGLQDHTKLCRHRISQHVQARADCNHISRVVRRHILYQDGMLMMLIMYAVAISSGASEDVRSYPELLMPCSRPSPVRKLRRRLPALAQLQSRNCGGRKVCSARVCTVLPLQCVHSHAVCHACSQCFETLGIAVQARTSMLARIPMMPCTAHCARSRMPAIRCACLLESLLRPMIVWPQSTHPPMTIREGAVSSCHFSWL